MNSRNLLSLLLQFRYVISKYLCPCRLTLRFEFYFLTCPGPATISLRVGATWRSDFAIRSSSKSCALKAYPAGNTCQCRFWRTQLLLEGNPSVIMLFKLYIRGFFIDHGIKWWVEGMAMSTFA